MQKAFLYITIVICLFLLSGVESTAQNVRVGMGTQNPQSALDVVSTTGGVLIPRMTATEIEALAGPEESELVFSLSGDGAVINKSGFWYFSAGTWLPLTEDIVLEGNIYTEDGTLVSDRTVNQDGKLLNFGPDLLYIDGSTSSVGIATDSPTRTLDVDGNVRVQNLATVANLVSGPQGLLLHEESFFEYGDVKPSYLSADHDGWYLLDGRDLSGLPADARQNALNILGTVTALPDATGRYSRGTTSATATTLGSNMVSLSRINLPNMNFSYTTNAGGAHSHAVTYQRARTNATHGGGNNIHIYWLAGTISGTATYTRSTNSVSHNHSYTINSGGSSTPLNIAPRAINFNYFVYLGQ